jgi:transposase
MPRTCSICKHKQLEQINKELINGTSYRAISGRFGVSKSSLERHHKNHLPADLTKAKAAGEIAQADSLLAQLQTLQGQTLSILKQAESTKDHNTALKAIAEARRNLELLAKVTGDLAQEGAVNINLLIPVLLDILSSEIQDSRTLERIADKMQELENNNFKAVRLR